MNGFFLNLSFNAYFIFVSQTFNLEKLKKCLINQRNWKAND